MILLLDVLHYHFICHVATAATKVPSRPDMPSPEFLSQVWELSQQFVGSLPFQPLQNATARRGIFMIDASRGFIKDGNKNRLCEQDIHRIVDTFARMVDVPRYSRLVPMDEIDDPKNDYNLNLPRYIDSTKPEDLQDIDGHLRGGTLARDLDALDHYWQVIEDLPESNEFSGMRLIMRLVRLLRYNRVLKLKRVNWC